MGNRERKKVRAENNDPINFTCGNCKRVQKFEGVYECPYCAYCKIKKEEDNGISAE